MRLDLFLQGRVEEFSRSWIQKLIKKGAVRVEGNEASPSYRLAQGERVSLKKEFPVELTLEPEPHVSPQPSVLFEHRDFVILDKPAGLVVHPAVSTPRGTLVHWLLAHYPEVAGVGEEKFRPGIVHRLDKETSGVMVVARTQPMFQHLKQAFADRRVTKKYTALVLGTLDEEDGSVSYPIGRAKTDPTKQRVYRNLSRASRTSRNAQTYWRVLKRYARTTLVEVTPVTGRMHQIRVHMQAIGHPVAGDRKYARKRMRGPKTVGRLFLHASFLSFEGPKGEKFSFSSPLPADLARALKNLPFMVE